METRFDDLGLSATVLKAIADAGYSHPTPIQAKSIPPILMGRDLLGLAQTGTGKTASFVLPMIDILAQKRARARMPRSLILSPTRELATQIAENFEAYSRYQALKMALLIGGTSVRDQENELTKGVDVLIATPGRLLDLFERGAMMLTDVQIFVVDEADRMLDMGFIPDIERIAGLLNQGRKRPQTLFFSATMPSEIGRLADTFLDNPKEVQVAPPATTATTVEQQLVRLPSARQKRKVLQSILSTTEGQALLFCNRKRDIGELVRALKSFDAAPLHGDLPQSQRTETLDAFRDGAIRILVCSDVAARGIDVQDLPLVINVDVPVHADDYVHRIGRTGRAGKAGRAITLAGASDEKALLALEAHIGQKIPPYELNLDLGKTAVSTNPEATASYKFARWPVDETLEARAAKVFEAHVPGFLLMPAAQPRNSGAA